MQHLLDELEEKYLDEWVEASEANCVFYIKAQQPGFLEQVIHILKKYLNNKYNPN
ncbi:MAG: hypothetical protein HYZ15_03340 [Sphingobacteriales bacterium]|nr:hypothetical protein [Sphingobacteriales bacterium]